MKRSWFVCALLALGVGTFGNSSAEAGEFGGRYWRGQRGRGYNGPIYHGPSVHYDKVYHEESRHWTPFRGWHSHGHVDIVPHYVPGHIDYRHRGHVHGNPDFHDDH